MGDVGIEHRVVFIWFWALLHYRIMGDVGIEHRVVFIDGFGYLTPPWTLKMKRPASNWAV